MQTSEPGPKAEPRADEGMTLVELLVVVTVVSVLAVGAVMTAGRSSRATVAQDMTHFVSTWQLVSDIAVQSRIPHGLRVTDKGLQIMQLDATGWRTRGAMRNWNGRATFAGARRSGAATRTVPEVVFLPTGQSTPHSVSFSGAGPTLICQGDGWAVPTCG